MKFATLRDNSPVTILDDKLVLLTDLGFDGSLKELIEAGSEKLKSLKSRLNSTAATQDFKLNDLDAPYKNPSKIVAVGLNYVDHAHESNMKLPKSPIVFTKFPSAIIAASDPVIIPTKLTKEVDFEVELGVVIGKKAKNVSEAEALNYVFGYTVLNDVSARNLQFEDGQWVRAKSLDTFCPWGPYIVTVDEVANPQNLNLGCRVNGVEYQNSNTREMIFSVARIISELSHSFTFEPGDLIATGTPSGVGFSRKPPVYLHDGDTLRTWVEGIGEMINPVVEE